MHLNVKYLKITAAVTDEWSRILGYNLGTVYNF